MMNFKYPHLELYYTTWAKSFTKSADAIVLFYHWCLVQNGFECLVNEKETSLLPDNWNTISKESYQIYYMKRKVKFRLEIFLIGEILHIELKRFSDMTDTSQLIKITDFLNLDLDYKSQPYKELFKNLNRLKHRIDWAIQNIKPPKPANSCTTSKSEPLDLINRIKLNRNELTAKQTNERRDSSNSVTSIHSSSSSSNAIIITNTTNMPPNCTLKNNKRMKKSTQKKSDRMENDSTSAKSNHKGGFIIENDIAIDPNTNQAANESAPNNLPQPAVAPTTSKANHLSRADLFDYNPITNFIGYNKNIDEIKSIDEKILNENDQVKDLFEKNKCKKCSIKIIDCFKTGVLNNQSAPVILTDKIKNALITNTNDSHANNVGNKSSKKNSKTNSAEVKSTKRNLRGTRRIISTTTESDNASMKSTNESDSESLASSDTNAMTSRAKRKRSVFSSESSHSIETISSSHSSNHQVVDKCAKDTESSHNETLVSATNESREESLLAFNHPNTSGIASCSGKSKTKKISEYFLSNEKLNTTDPGSSKDTSMEVQTPSVAISTSSTATNSNLETNTTETASSSTPTAVTSTINKEQSLNHTGGKENAMVDLNTSETDPPAKKFKSTSDLATTSSALTEDRLNTPCNAKCFIMQKQPLKTNNSDPLFIPNKPKTIACIIGSTTPTTTINTSPTSSCLNATINIPISTTTTTDTSTVSPKKSGFITNFLKRFPVKISESTIAKQFEEAASNIRPLSFTFGSLVSSNSSTTTADNSIENIPTTFASLNNSTSEDSDCTIIDERPGGGKSNQNDDLESNSSSNPALNAMNSVKIEKQ